jgi:uncharacterized protein
MQYRRFGKTERFISVFSLGTMRCLSSPAVFEQTVEQALAMGINHFETAAGYGSSELWLGQALTALGCDRAALAITTKIPPTPDAEAMAAQIELALSRLQLDYIDCLALHGLNTAEHLEWVLRPNGCMTAVWAAVARGQIRHVGFSTHGDRATIAGAIRSGLFEFINLHHYYFFQRHADLVALAEAADLGIFIISPADKGGLLHRPPARLQQLCAPLEPLQLTYRWLLSDRGITTLSLGPAGPAELDSALAAVDWAAALGPGETAALARLAAQLEAGLGPEQCRQCDQCLPCPEAIAIPEVLRLRNLAVAYEMTAYGEYRYRMFENAGHWFAGRKANRCTDCGDCLPRCPEQLNIPALLRDTHTRLQGPERRRLWE